MLIIFINKLIYKKKKKKKYACVTKFINLKQLIIEFLLENFVLL